jgi:hypothetical protein
MMALRHVLALMLLLMAIACSAPGGNDQVGQDSTPPAAAGGATAQPESETQETAEQVCARLAARIPTARLSVVYNAQTDPNGLLGTPNAYVSKAAFTDTRIDPAQANDTEIGSIELGGSVEVFRNEADARARKQYIDETLADLPIEVSEYSYVHGAELLRLSRRLTPEQAAEYEAALDAP